MAYETINIGTVANDGTGDSPRAAGEKINNSFTQARLDAEAANTQALRSLSGAARVANTTPLFGTPVEIADDSKHRAFPGFAIARDGTFVVAYRESINHNVVVGADRGVTKVQRSTDMGRTWSAAVTAVDYGSLYDTRDVCVATLSDGRLAITGFRSDDEATTGPVQSTFVAFSSDHGVTWDTPITISGTGTYRNVTCAPLVELDNGTLMATLFYLNNGDALNRRSVQVVFSTNGGQSWGSAVVVAHGPTDNLDYVEPFTVKLDGDNLLCLIREESTGEIYVTSSANNGASWSATASKFAGGGRPAAVYGETGTITCLYRKKTGVSKMMMRASHDDGATWTNASVAAGATGETYAYAQLQEVRPGTVAAGYSIETTGSPSTAAYVALAYITEGSGDTPLGAIGRDSLVYDQTVLEADAASVTITGLTSLGGYAAYEILIEGAGSDSDNLLMYLNGDEVAANYESVELRAAGTSATANHVAGARIGYLRANNAVAQVCRVLLVSHSFRNKIAICQYTQVNAWSSGSVVTGHVTYGWKNDANVTSIKIVPAAGNLKLGTRIRVWMR